MNNVLLSDVQLEETARFQGHCHGPLLLISVAVKPPLPDTAVESKLSSVHHDRNTPS